VATETENKVRLFVVKQVYKSDMGELLLKYFASRQRDSNVTKLDRAVQVAKAHDPSASFKKVRRVFMALEKAGAGTYIVGRRGNPTRFVWSTSMIELGKAVMPKRGRKPKSRAA
jgi:hypothetical protein